MSTLPALPARLARRALLLSAFLLAPLAHAAPALVTHISGATAQVDANPPGNNNFNFVADIGQKTSAEAQASFVYQGGSVSSLARSAADLEAGTVRVDSSLFITNQTDGFVSMATSFIGDGYRHFVGDTPFTWTGSTTARFDIRLTGNASLAGNVGSLFNAGLVFLMIYPKDTLNDFVPFCGDFQSYFWSIGPGVGPTNPCGGSFLGSFNDEVDQTLSLTFNHPGDFDWAFGVRVGGAASAQSGSSIQWLNDFFSTAELFYTPPEGVTSIQSGSGFVLSPGTNGELPLPGSLALAGLALAAMGGTVRRRRAQPAAA